MKHFKLTTESTVNAFGVTLFRVELIIDCKWGSKGDKGGFVEKEENIKDAWVYGNAQVSGNARVYGNAWEKSPLQIQGSKHFFNICKKGFVQIGCHSFEFQYWQENFEQIGKNNNYTEEEIKEYGFYIDLAIKLSK
jgi:hypothetical protein